MPVREKVLAITGAVNNFFSLLFNFEIVSHLNANAFDASSSANFKTNENTCGIFFSRFQNHFFGLEEGTYIFLAHYTIQQQIASIFRGVEKAQGVNGGGRNKSRPSFSVYYHL